MSKGFHLSGEYVTVDIYAPGFFAKTTGTSKCTAARQAIPIPRRFDGENFADGPVRKAAFKFSAHLIKEMNIHLMVQKSIHFQHISFFDDAVLLNSFL